MSRPNRLVSLKELSVVAVAWLVTAVVASQSATALNAYLGIGCIVAGVVWTLCWRLGRGVWYSLLLFGAINALPGPSLENINKGGIFGTDAFALLLILSLFVFQSQNGFRAFRTKGSVPRTLALCSALFLALWLVTVLRTWAFEAIPLTRALQFGRDFVYFALLLPLFSAEFADRRVRDVFLLAAAAGVAYVAATESLVSIRGGGLPSLVHVVKITNSITSVRVYANALYVVVAALPFAIGATLIARSTRVRAIGAFVTVCCVGDISLALSRGNWIAEVVGILSAVVVWLILGDPRGLTARRQFLQVLVAVVVAAGLLFTVRPPATATSSLSGVAQRVSSIFTDLTGNATTSTVAVRERESSELEHYLGDQWLFGLGFLDPRNRYFAGLPTWSKGSIRNSDTGILNLVMTMGVVGAFLQLIPVAIIAGRLVLLRFALGLPEQDNWLAFGSLGFAVLLLVGTPTLGLLYEPLGVVVTAPALAVGASLLTTRRSARAPAMAAASAR
jgi:hypothetical protein